MGLLGCSLSDDEREVPLPLLRLLLAGVSERTRSWLVTSSTPEIPSTASSAARFSRRLATDHPDRLAFASPRNALRLENAQARLSEFDRHKVCFS
jgi:hypothetical protein